MKVLNLIYFNVHSYSKIKYLNLNLNLMVDKQNEVLIKDYVFEISEKKNVASLMIVYRRDRYSSWINAQSQENCHLDLIILVEESFRMIHQCFSLKIASLIAI